MSSGVAEVAARVEVDKATGRAVVLGIGADDDEAARAAAARVEDADDDDEAASAAIAVIVVDLDAIPTERKKVNVKTRWYGKKQTQGFQLLKNN